MPLSKRHRKPTGHWMRGSWPVPCMRHRSVTRQRQPRSPPQHRMGECSRNRQPAMIRGMLQDNNNPKYYAEPLAYERFGVVGLRHGKHQSSPGPSTIPPLLRLRKRTARTNPRCVLSRFLVKRRCGKKLPRQRMDLPGAIRPSPLHLGVIVPTKPSLVPGPTNGPGTPTPTERKVK